MAGGGGGGGILSKVQNVRKKLKRRGKGRGKDKGEYSSPSLHSSPLLRKNRAVLGKKIKTTNMGGGYKPGFGEKARRLQFGPLTLRLKFFLRSPRLATDISRPTRRTALNKGKNILLQFFGFATILTTLT